MGRMVEGLRGDGKEMYFGFGTFYPDVDILSCKEC